ncbi:MAG: hypothetical protein AB7K71_39650 [Polyangiaceae bacterium]
MNSTMRLVLGITSVWLGTTACSNTEAPAGEAAGSVDLALQATGPDGATYRLTPNTLLWVSNQDQSVLDALYIESAETVQTFSLPPDDYEATVRTSRPDGSFELERSDGTQTEIVSARYVGVNPTPFHITANSTTALTLPFRVADLGDITFDVGRLAVDLDVGVEAQSPTGGQMSLQAAHVDQQTFGGELSGVSDYEVATDASIDQSWAWRITSPFRLTTANRACAAIEVTSAQSNQAAWTDLFRIVPHSLGELCVIDNDPYPYDTVQLSTRQTADLTGTGLTDFLSGSSYEVFTYVDAYVPSNALEGNTLHLDQLVDTHTQFEANAYYTLIGAGVTEAPLEVRGPGHLQSGVN